MVSCSKSYFPFIGNKKCFISFVYLQRLSLDNVMIPLFGTERLYPCTCNNASNVLQRRTTVRLWVLFSVIVLPPWLGYSD